MYIPIC